MSETAWLIVFVCCFILLNMLHKAIVDRIDGVRLQVSFGNEMALIYPWQIGKDAR